MSSGFIDLRDQLRVKKDESLTICYQYYDDKKSLERLFDTVSQYPASVRERFKIRIVDDCSKDHPIEKWLSSLKKLNISAYKIENDLRWNQGGARNLNAYLSTTKWSLFTDIDHVVCPKNIEPLLDFVENKADVSSMYWVARYDRRDDKIPAHVNTYLIATNVFRMLGGVDEDFVGHYGYEDKFFVEEVKARGIDKKVIEEAYLRVEEYKAGNQLQKISRDLARNKMLFEAKLNRQSFRSYLALRFSYSQIC